MIKSSSLGFPRMGSKRELKKAMESFWSGQLSKALFLEQADAIKQANWQLQKQKKIDFIPSNDFSLYDHVLDTAVMVGAVPRRYNWSGGEIDLKTYYTMARGEKGGATAMEMTKWFDTNYHYIVPEFEENQKFVFSDRKVINEFKQAKALGIHTRPVILGPISFLKLGKSRSGPLEFVQLLDSLLPVYESILQELVREGADWIQIDEPCLIQSLTQNELDSLLLVYTRLSKSSDKIKILLATYFGGLRENLDPILRLPINGLHVDLVRDSKQLDLILTKAPAKLSLSLGLISGRNIWKSDLAQALETARKALLKIGPERLIIAPSCSLLLSPIDLADETEMDPDIKNWLAFATQKLEEISIIAAALTDTQSVSKELNENKLAIQSRKVSTKVHNPQVKERLRTLKKQDVQRHAGYSERKMQQQKALHLPLFPTTTIGSFAQTDEVRVARANHKSGKLSSVAYEDFLKKEVRNAISFQEEIHMDVLVHGEFERNDMVEYFGEKLEGFVHTKNGWVQSYGSRCVKPPIIFGDISRPKPMTVDWWKYAQSCTQKPVKGMLTGPVTILQWSFVRDDQARAITCKQIAFVLRDEVVDLEKSGAQVVQIDEPALREGLPLRREDWQSYLEWAVESFRISSCGVQDKTQIHTHMCYSEFNDIIEAIGNLDADVISIETSRSQMELLHAFSDYKYPNEIGPGVYDIHTPRVPSETEIYQMLKTALKVLSPEQLWVNPDCGLKTRRWEEIKPSLAAMTAAAARLRQEYSRS